MAVTKFPIEAGHVLMFARSIGDENRIYSDEDYAKTTEPGAIIAPPTFVQASAQFDPEYFLRPHPSRPWHGSGKNPTGMAPPAPAAAPAAGAAAPAVAAAGGGGLHAEQHYVYHRQLKVGDVLSATMKPGKTWEREGRRGGKLRFSESITEYRDQKGELVVTATSVGVQTERPATAS